VAATDVDGGGVISPGGVGYDINCGVRLLRTNLTRADIENRQKELVSALFGAVPSGVGSKGSLSLRDTEERQAMRDGAKWAVGQGYGTEWDLQHTEAEGRLPGAKPDFISPKAVKRGSRQVGTLGSGNHFLEVQVVDEVFDAEAAKATGIEQGALTVMIHTGSRGFGHQVCDDTIRHFRGLMKKQDFDLPDPQLCCAPIDSKPGQTYLGAMACAANYAWANRQMITFLVRRTLGEFFGKKIEELGLELVYDVAHNIAKLETHTVGGKTMNLCVHRKGATRAFPPGHPELPDDYRAIGQPVIIPGDMGTESYLLRGTEKAMQLTFGSTCHGAGRVMGRKAAIRYAKGRSIKKEMAEQGIFVKYAGKDTLAEEASFAYKDVSQVVDTVHAIGISTKIARFKPLVVAKG
jgi:tRNA-splicing ligase RtcB